MLPSSDRERATPSRVDVDKQPAATKHESLGSKNQNSKGAEAFVDVPKVLLDEGLITKAQFRAIQAASAAGAGDNAPGVHATGATWQLHSDPWKEDD